MRVVYCVSVHSVGSWLILLVLVLSVSVINSVIASVINSVIVSVIVSVVNSVGVCNVGPVLTEQGLRCRKAKFYKGQSLTPPLGYFIMYLVCTKRVSCLIPNSLSPKCG